MSDAELHSRLEACLATFKDPETGRPLSKTGQVTDWKVMGGHVECQLSLTTHSAPIANAVRERFCQHLETVSGVTSVNVRLGTFHRPPVTLGQIGLKVKSIIAVGAGKGGVGKSSLAASLALSLERLGSRVGLMDADVYGPSIPHLLGLSGRPEIVDGKIQPAKCGTMPVMSMGLLLEKDQAVIWRGPMLHGSITQFLRDTDWGELDYLIIDLPPGTGDVVLTLSQLIPLAGAVVICTPQEVALLDAVKAIAMFEKTKTPILGLVENMSGFLCAGCGKTYDIFGKGGARAKAEEKGIAFLGAIPIQMAFREASDEGRLANVLVEDPECRIPFEKVAMAVVTRLAEEASKGGLGAPLPVLG